jgi:RHS repeat-associated protein
LNNFIWIGFDWENYSPFGMVIPERKYVGGPYRYGFNGKENDNEVKGQGNQQDYGMRIYDSRLGKFLSVDPLAPNFPWYTPYQFAGNMPIWASDVDGSEPATQTRFDKALKMVIEFKNDKSIKAGVFKHISKEQLVNYLVAVLKDQTKLRSPYNSCGPTSAIYVAATHDPEQFIRIFIDLWKNGSANDGDIVAPSNLKTFNYPDNSWLDVALLGSVRSSENWLYPGFDPQRKDDDSKYRNGTTPNEYADLIERMGVSVDIESTSTPTFDQLLKWTLAGKRLVVFGYMSLLEGKDGHTPSEDDQNWFDGDHFVTVHSINVNKKTKEVIVKYWDHGEKSARGLRSYTFSNQDQFVTSIRKAYFLTNTGNEQDSHSKEETPEGDGRKH